MGGFMNGKHNGDFGCGQDLRGHDGRGVRAVRLDLELFAEPTPSALVDERSAARERAVRELAAATRELAEFLRHSFPDFGFVDVDLDDDDLDDDDLDDDLEDDDRNIAEIRVITR